MKTEIDIKFIKERYEQMSDDELIRIATRDAYGLTPEAMNIVKLEVEKRGLDNNINKGLEAQNKEYTDEEINAYCNFINILNCPTCGSNNEKLNATMTGEVISFIVFTSYTKKLKVACPTCLDKENNKALTKTALLGWWGFPWGLIKTPQYISLNLKSKRTNHLKEHNDHLKNFALSIMGELETYKDNKEQLQQILLRQNRL